MQIEHSCKVNCTDLTKKFDQMTTQGGLELWNPHHFKLDLFEKRLPRQSKTKPNQISQWKRLSEPSSQGKNLYNMMERTYINIAFNIGAINKMTLKKMRN